MKYISLLFVMFFLQSCGAEKATLHFSAPQLESANGGLTGEQRMAFTALQVKVLEPKKCIVCHKDFKTAEGLAPLFEPGQPDFSKLFLRVEDGTMPRDLTSGSAVPLTTKELQYVRDYINSFTPNPGT